MGARVLKWLENGLSFETWGRGCVEDSDPDDVNPFDDDSVGDVKSAYKAERQALKDEYKAEVSDLKDRLDDF